MGKILLYAGFAGIIAVIAGKSTDVMTFATRVYNTKNFFPSLILIGVLSFIISDIKNSGAKQTASAFLLLLIVAFIFSNSKLITSATANSKSDGIISGNPSVISQLYAGK